jgi:hypothetical protein
VRRFDERCVERAVAVLDYQDVMGEVHEEAVGWVSCAAQVIGGSCGVGPESIHTLGRRRRARYPVARPAAKGASQVKEGLGVSQEEG